MADYFAVGDIKDNVIKDVITIAHVQAATNEVNAIARSLGVSVADIESTAYEVVELAKDYGCYLAAFESEGSALSNSFSGAGMTGSDIYTTKKDSFWKKFNTRKASMTPEIFKGSADNKAENVAVIELYRG